MDRLYRKSEIGFAIVWIVAYVVLTSLADSASASLGAIKSLTAALHIVMTAVLWVWIRKSGLQEKYGFCGLKQPAGRFLFFVPLIIIASSALWGGVALRWSGLETACYVVSMCCVGFLEEVIFRGLLFKAMAKENLRRAVVVSAVTFGLGHIVNLLNGKPLGDTLMQIVFAVMLGFVLVLIFHRGGSLIPCILFHSANNALFAFASENGLDPRAELAVSIGLIVLGFAYAAALVKLLPEREGP